MKNIEKYKNEIVELKKWFDWYDTQSIQSARDIRLRGYSNIDIDSLDNEAEIKKVRIKELQELIKKEYEKLGA